MNLLKLWSKHEKRGKAANGICCRELTWARMSDCHLLETRKWNRTESYLVHKIPAYLPNTGTSQNWISASKILKIPQYPQTRFLLNSSLKMAEADRIKVYLAVFRHSNLDVDWKAFSAELGISLTGNAWVATRRIAVSFTNYSGNENSKTVSKRMAIRWLMVRSVLLAKS